MSEPLTKEGKYRARIVGYWPDESQKGAFGVKLKCEVTATSSSEGGWIDCEPCDVEGTIWLIKKDGEPNEGAVKSLMEHAGWDGNLESLVDGWVPKPVCIEVKNEEYNGVTRTRVAFINGYDSGGSVTRTRLAELQAKFGHRLAALGGAVTPTKRDPLAPPPPSGPNADIPF